MPTLTIDAPKQQAGTARFLIPQGHTLLLDSHDMEGHRSLRLTSGLVRVGLSSAVAEPLDCRPITLGFLQNGDSIALEALRHSWLHLEALDATTLVDGGGLLPCEGCSSLHEWTTAMLLIQHLGHAEHRLRALMQLMVDRLGRRCGAWYELPMHLSHERIAEIVSHSRVTVTKTLGHWRRAGLIDTQLNAAGGLRISPRLVELGV
jgi:CRP-like cAMP-binding protein